MSNKTLYIIGNGFDLHHGYKTSYSDFKDFLKESSPETYNWLEEYVFKQNETLWWEFEKNLGYLDLSLVLNDFLFRIPPYNFDQLSTMHLSLFLNITRGDIAHITERIISEFRKFILVGSLFGLDNNNKIKINKNALFLSFNFTESLETKYDIPFQNITNIHNSVLDESKEIVLGHSRNYTYETYESDVMKVPLDTDENTLIKEAAADIYMYFTKMFKPTNKIIVENQAFFNKLNCINDVHVYGHSISEVDLPYFKEITKNIKPNSKWTVSYYKPEEKNKFKETLVSIGVQHNNIKLITLEELAVSV